MLAPRVVQAGLVDQEVLEHPASNDRLVKNPRDIFERHAAVEDALGIDGQCRPVFALGQAPGRVRPDRRLETALLDLGLQGRTQTG